MTNGQLFRFHSDIESMKGSILEFWNQERIAGFYRLHGSKLDSLNKRLEALSEEYFQITDGKMTYGENQEPLMLEGKNILEYKAKFAAIMKEENNLIVAR